MIVPEEFTVEELDDGLSTVKRSTDVASSWCCTQQNSVSWNDRIGRDAHQELDAGAATPSITIVCDGLSKGNFLFGTGWCNPCAF